MKKIVYTLLILMLCSLLALASCEVTLTSPEDEPGDDTDQTSGISTDTAYALAQQLGYTGSYEEFCFEISQQMTDLTAKIESISLYNASVLVRLTNGDYIYLAIGNSTPGDNTPGDNTPGDNTPGDNTPGDNTPGDNTPGDNTPGDDTPGDDTPGDDTPGDDTPGDDTPGDDTPGDDTPGDDTPVQDTTLQGIINMVENAYADTAKATIVISALDETVLYEFSSEFHYDSDDNALTIPVYNYVEEDEDGDYVMPSRPDGTVTANPAYSKKLLVDLSSLTFDVNYFRDKTYSYTSNTFRAEITDCTAFFGTDLTQNSVNLEILFRNDAPKLVSMNYKDSAGLLVSITIEFTY